MFFSDFRNFPVKAIANGLLSISTTSICYCCVDLNIETTFVDFFSFTVLQII